MPSFRLWKWFFCLSLLSILNDISRAQPIEEGWITTGGGYYDDVISSFIIDKEDNLYLSGNISFNPSYSITQLGDSVLPYYGYTSNAYTAKLNEYGELLWLRIPYSSGTNENLDIVATPKGGVIVSGSFTSQISFDSLQIHPFDGSNGYIIHYNEHGQLLWLVHIKARMGGLINRLNINAEGDLIVAGQFNSNELYIDTFKIEGGKGANAFIIKIDIQTGDLVWSKVLITNNAHHTGHIIVKEIEFDSNNNIYLLGGLNADELIADNQSIFAKSNSDYLTYLMKIDRDGHYLNTKLVHKLYPYELEIFNNDELLIRGEIRGNIYIDQQIVETPLRFQDLLIKLKTNFELDWVKLNDVDRGKYSKMKVDSLNNIYLLGYFAESYQSDSFAIQSKGANDVLFVKYNSLGSTQWVSSTGGTADEYGDDFTFQNNGAMLMTGRWVGCDNDIIGVVAESDQGVCTLGKKDFYITRIPVVNPDFNISNACAGDTTRFLESATYFHNRADISAWDWSFGDNTYSSEKNPYHIYMQEGTYHARLVLTTTQGSRFKAEKTIKVNKPPVAEISVLNNSLITGTGDSYTWYFNGDTISESVSQTIALPKVGEYKVEIVKNGCSSLSEPFYFQYTGLTPENNVLQAIIYPNPFSGAFKIVVENDLLSSFTLKDLSGRIYLNENNIRKESIEYTSLEHMPSGIYLLEVHASNSYYVSKVLKR